MEQIWEYEILGGFKVRGVFIGFSDRGGTDVSYRFHRLDGAGNKILFDNGGIRLDIVSGSALKKACNVTSGC